MRSGVYRHGINDVSDFTWVDGKMPRDLRTWYNMLERCYSEKSHLHRPTYVGCSVCPEWLYFSQFKAWYDENYREGFQLDKDILVPGNKIYSPESCRYVPPYINSLLLDCGASRGELPLGIDRNRTAFRAACSNGQGKRVSRNFGTVEDAVAWYKETKKCIVKQQAIHAFLANEIKSDVYLALVQRDF